LSKALKGVSTASKRGLDLVCMAVKTRNEQLANVSA
jgi:hypothetical protein